MNPTRRPVLQFDDHEISRDGLVMMRLLPNGRWKFIWALDVD